MLEHEKSKGKISKITVEAIASFLIHCHPYLPKGGVRNLVKAFEFTEKEESYNDMAQDIIHSKNKTEQSGKVREIVYWYWLVRELKRRRMRGPKLVSLREDMIKDSGRLITDVDGIIEVNESGDTQRYFWLQISKNTHKLIKKIGHMADKDMQLKTLDSEPREDVPEILEALTGDETRVAGLLFAVNENTLPTNIKREGFLKRLNEEADKYSCFDYTDIDLFCAPEANFFSMDRIGDIERFYAKGEEAGKLDTYKETQEGSFIRPPKSVLRKVSEHFLKNRTHQKVLVANSGTAKAGAVFSLASDDVTCMERDAELHAQGMKAVRGLDDSGIIDKNRIRIVNQNFWKRKFSRYDLVYFGWPYSIEESKEMAERFEEKLLKELKPGAVFVVNCHDDKKLKKFTKLEKIDLPSSYENIHVYRIKGSGSDHPGRRSLLVRMAVSAVVVLTSAASTVAGYLYDQNAIMDLSFNDHAGELPLSWLFGVVGLSTVMLLNKYVYQVFPKEQDISIPECIKAMPEEIVDEKQTADLIKQSQ